MPQNRTVAGGCFFTLLIPVGFLVGLAMGSPLGGSLAGVAAGIIAALAVWLIDRRRAG